MSGRLARHQPPWSVHLGIAGATVLELANDDALWADFLALIERARVLAEANALNRDAAEGRE
jgi:hypothetical protein